MEFAGKYGEKKTIDKPNSSLRRNVCSYKCRKYVINARAHECTPSFCTRGCSGWFFLQLDYDQCQRSDHCCCDPCVDRPHGRSASGLVHRTNLLSLCNYEIMNKCYYANNINFLQNNLERFSFPWKRQTFFSKYVKV